MNCKFCAAEPAADAVPISDACVQCAVVRADRKYVEGDAYTIISVPDCVRVYVSKQAVERIRESNLDEFRARVQAMAAEATKGTVSESFFGLADDRHEFWARLFANGRGEHVAFVMTGDEGVDEIVLTV